MRYGNQYGCSMQLTFAGNGAMRVFSSGFFCTGVVEIQASPKLWTSVGDVQFPRWVHGAPAGQASLAMEPLPDASCQGRQLFLTTRCGKPIGSILLHRSWGVHILLY